tara:strand:- start:17656 stop:17982 length:327 start_codon:yes stop_codon:yes gene_type:complete
MKTLFTMTCLLLAQGAFADEIVSSQIQMSSESFYYGALNNHYVISDTFSDTTSEKIQQIILQDLTTKCDLKNGQLGPITKMDKSYRMEGEKGAETNYYTISVEANCLY